MTQHRFSLQWCSFSAQGGKIDSRGQLLWRVILMRCREALVATVYVEGQARNDVCLKGDCEGSQNLVDDSKKGKGHRNEPDNGACTSFIKG